MNDSYIPKEHYIDEAPNTVEDSPIHIDHTECSAGMDTKKRLYIWRRLDQSVFAYCHNCGLKGTTRGKNTRNIHKLRRSSKRGDKPKVVYLPRDMEKDPQKWPVEARAWVYHAGLTDEEVIRYGLGYSGYIRRVIVPCFDSTDTLLGFQTRRIFNEDTKPKYLTRVAKNTKLLFSSRHTPSIYTPSDTCVIVEDALSCIKVGRTHHAIALMGCSTNDQILEYLTNKFRNVIIFLDNDNHDVKKKQEQLRLELELLMDNVTVIKYDKDPKNCTTEELNKVLSK